MPGSGAAALTVGGAFVLVLLTAMTLDVFSGFWDALVENKGPGASSRVPMCMSRTRVLSAWCGPLLAAGSLPRMVAEPVPAPPLPASIPHSHHGGRGPADCLAQPAR